MNPHSENHEYKVAYARASLWAPFYAVGMAARIQCDVPIDLIEAVLYKLRILHPLLASRVRVDQDGVAWLTTEGVGEFPIEVRLKTSDDDWARVMLEQERLPFAFDRGPITRFFLLRGAQSTDLVLVAPHVICDGYSITQVMGDVIALLNDPNRAVTRSAPPPPVTWQTMPHSVYDNLLLRGLVRICNYGWPGPRVVLQQAKYEDLHRQYWARQQHDLLAFSLSPAETSNLIARCRQHDVSVTGALVAALVLTQNDVRPASQTNPCKVSVSVNIRDRMTQSPGRAVGVYASSIDIRIRPKSGTPFWTLAGEGHARIHKAVADRAKILLPLVLQELDPSIVDTLVAAIATDQWGLGSELLTHFVGFRGQVHCLNVSNIGRVELPQMDGPYRLQALLPFPPSVPGSSLALNVLTVDGQMNMIMKYQPSQMDNAAATRIRDRALSYLLGA